MELNKKLFFVLLVQRIKFLKPFDWLNIYRKGFTYKLLNEKMDFTDLLSFFQNLAKMLNIKFELFENTINYKFLNELREEIDFILNEYKENWQIIFYNDKEYPQNFYEIKNPPLYLFITGPLLNYLNHPLKIAIIGSRKSTPYGHQLTKDIIKSIAPYNLPIVSGLALGIDAYAHELALQYKLPCIAFLPSGLFHCYPSQNKYLYDRLKAEGLLITEYLFSTKPKSYFFCHRNRLISGISQCVIIPEAGINSGSVMTGHLALEQGKEVYTLPGNIYQENSSGCHQLLKENAQICSNPLKIMEQILDDLPDYIGRRNLIWQKKKILSNFSKQVNEKRAEKIKNSEKSLIISTLKNNSYSFAELLEILKIADNILRIELARLEIEGKIINQWGKYFLNY